MAKEGLADTCPLALSELIALSFRCLYMVTGSGVVFATSQNNSSIRW